MTIELTKEETVMLASGLMLFANIADSDTMTEIRLLFLKLDAAFTKAFPREDLQ